MTVPLAVQPSVKSPGVYLNVNLLAGVANPGSARLRALLLASKSSAGNIVANTEVRTVFGPDDVAVALGAGTLGHLAAKMFFLRNPQGSLDIVAPAESAGANAAATQTFTGTATANSTLRLRAHGRIIDTAWNAGETAATFITRYVATINAQTADLFVIAADATGGDVSLTAKVKGPPGNDVKVNVSIIAGGAGITIAANPTALTGGTTEPDFTTALTSVATRSYRRIVPCVSNADSTSASGSSNPGRVQAHVVAHQSGNDAKLQVFSVGNTATIANVKAGAIAKNDPAGEYVYGQNYEDLPCECAAADAGDALRFIGIRANFNRIGNVLGLRGPQDPVADKLTGAELEDLLNNGVTALDVQTFTGQIIVTRPVTTHSLNGSAADYRALDLPDTDAIYTVAEDLRDSLPQEFANCSVVENLPPGVNRLPAGVVELKDIRGFLTSRLGFWVDQGVLDGDKLQAALDAQQLLVEINASDATQVDIFLPLGVVKVLSKMGVTVAKTN